MCARVSGGGQLGLFSQPTRIRRRDQTVVTLSAEDLCGRQCASHGICGDDRFKDVRPCVPQVVQCHCNDPLGRHTVGSMTAHRSGSIPARTDVPSGSGSVIVKVGSRTAVPLHRGSVLRLHRPMDAPRPAYLAEVRAWVARQASPTAVELFCGAGGLSLGLHDAGFSVLAGADSDRFSVETHVANLRGLGYCGDLTDPRDLLDHLAAWGIERVDVVAGGVPCQPFSRAGRQRLRSLVDAGQRSGDDARAHLWDSFLQVVAELKPRAVLVENVPDLAVWNDAAVLVGLQEGLRSLGFTTEARILGAYDHGVPQFRSRLFLVGISAGGRMRWPEPLPRRNTLRDAIADLPSVGADQRAETLAYEGPPSSQLQVRLRRGLTRHERPFIYDHITRAVRPDDAEAFALLRPGQTYDDLPARLQRYRNDIFRDKYKRLEWDNLSRTITAHIAKDGYWYIHPEVDRTLSIREAARLQTFPDWYRFAGPPSVRFRQIGNAVPPMLAEAVGRGVHLALATRSTRSRTATPEVGFREALLTWHTAEPETHPWRRGADPWHVLMAELCLQRTPIARVRGVYERLLLLAPSPSCLKRGANGAAKRGLVALDLGLRADLLVGAAISVVNHFDGRVPDDEIGLRSIPGVGENVANAVLAFGFGRRLVLVDTNTERIGSRVFRLGATGGRWQSRLDLFSLAGQRGPDPAFNAAVLALGRTVCGPSVPRCGDCPVVRHCSTGAALPKDSASAQLAIPAVMV